MGSVGSMNKRNFKLLFEEPDAKSRKWQDALYDAAHNGDDDEFNRLLAEANELYFEESQIHTAIEDYTSNGDPEERDRHLSGLKELDWVDDVKVEENGLLIKTKRGPIAVNRMSDVVNGFTGDLRLLSRSARKGQCHHDSIIMARMFEQEIFVVTGYVYGLTDKAKFLHSWVELEEEGKQLVADYTMNAIMNKDAYYMIQHAQELTRVSNKQIKEDWKILGQLAKKGITFMNNEYLVFRDEYMQDLKRNISEHDQDDR